MIAEMPPKFPKPPKLAKPEPESALLLEKGKSMAFVDASHELDPAKFVTFPNSPYQLYQPFPPAGD